VVSVRRWNEARRHAGDEIDVVVTDTTVGHEGGATPRSDGSRPYTELGKLLDDLARLRMIDETMCLTDDGS